MADAPSVQWLLIAVYPDVCSTPHADAVPYTIVSTPELAELTSHNVRYNSELAVKLTSVLSTCRGDEAGKSGKKSGTVMGVCTPIKGSRKVNVNGVQAMGVGDHFHMNNGNTKGVVIAVPAISHPKDPGHLEKAEFDRQVSGLITDMLSKHCGITVAAGKDLTNMRNGGEPYDPNVPREVYNNPVIVAAEHYFLAYNLRATGRDPSLMIAIWDGAKSISPKMADQFGKLLFPNMRQDHPQSLPDPWVTEWAEKGKTDAVKAIGGK